MDLWAAFILGFLGSLHCAGMCGPLALALPRACGAPFWVGRAAYNLGRVTTYVCLGLVFGLIGESFSLLGLQRWTSVAAGCSILLGVLISTRFTLQLPVSKFVYWVKGGVGQLLHHRSIISLLLLGLLNGLLPCGLVYVAGASAAATGDWAHGATHMLAFGAGTVPMMFGLSVGGPRLFHLIGTRGRRWIPVGVVLVGVLLILRGMALGIPLISPEGRCCH